jgi:hypothetical protein
VRQHGARLPHTAPRCQQQRFVRPLFHQAWITTVDHSDARSPALCKQVPADGTKSIRVLADDVSGEHQHTAAI